MADKKQERAALAAKMVAEQKAKQRRTTLLRVAGVGGAMAVIVAVCVVVGIKASGGSSSADTYLPPAGTSKYGMTVGDPKAPHQVIMYEDFLCPVCQAFEAAGGAQLQQLANAGKVYLDYRPFHLLSPDYSTQAANAFFVVWKASGEQVALKFHNLLYQTDIQPAEEDTSIIDGSYPVSKLVDLAVEAGADRSAVESEIENGDDDSMVTAATDEAYATGLNGTPTIYLDGKVFQQGTTMADLAHNLIKAVQ